MPQIQPEQKMRNPTRKQQRYHYKFLVVVPIVVVLYFALTYNEVVGFSSLNTPESTCRQFPEACEESAPFIFDSLFSLLKQWPNTYGSNGHSVIPITLPKNTLLYHAKQWQGQPAKPTWFAFDPEMSIGIYASTGITFLHTFISTQELTLIYLDGQSASLTYTGTLDSQTALLRGHVESNPGDDFIYNETNRGRELCRWAKELGIDGFVRMNAGFETLICNFSTSSLIEAIDVNITVPGRGAAVEDPRLPQDPNRRPPYGIGNDYGQQSSWEWIRSGTWHYGGYANGGQGHREQRVHLDMCGMVTFYDPRLTSLRGAHHGGIRGNDTYENGWGLRKGHRLLDISIEDSRKTIDWVKTTLRRHRSGSLSLEKLRPTSSKCSGINWQAMAETIVDQHKSRTEEIAGVLRQYHGGGLSNSEIVKRVHELSHAIIYPYLQYPTSNKTSPATVQQITTDRCSSIYTSHIREGTYNDFEGLLKDSIKIVLTRLCIWEWEIWQWTEGLTTDLLRSPNFGIDGSTSGRSSSSVDAEILEFESKTRDLLKWLGWDLWSDCDSRCSWDELCYIPMWPVIYAPRSHQGGIYAGSVLEGEELREFWKPKCLNRADFDRGGGRARDPKHQLPDVPDNITVHPFDSH